VDGEASEGEGGLMNEYEAAICKGRLRRVRTPEGARYFGLPIGSLITPKAIHAAMDKVGDSEKVLAALEREDLQNRGAEGMMDRSEARRAENIRVIREKLAAKAAADKHDDYIVPFQTRRRAVLARVAGRKK
jgi:hypothetical protein